MKAHLNFLAVCVGKLQRRIHAKSYKQSSRARWPLTLRTLLKIVAGVTVILLHGGQRRVHNVLLMSPIFLHRAAVSFALADGTWGDNPAGSGGRMFRRAGPFVSDDLDSYWRMVEYAVFTMPETDFEEWSALGVSYTRFSTLHSAMYTGIDETAIYSSKWSAIVERDTRHDLDTWNPSSADHHLERCR